VRPKALDSSLPEAQPAVPADVVRPRPGQVAHSPGKLRTWTFVTNHAQVLLVVAKEPELRVRQIARSVGITERSAYRILSDLVTAGYLTRSRVSRHNHYQLNSALPLGDPVVGTHTVSELLDALEARPH
jgi:DNA-binding transcriptional ArsR family regulator